ncbi:macrophage mannose receptor 1-like, partial [Scleropages formosus]
SLNLDSFNRQGIELCCSVAFGARERIGRRESQERAFGQCDQDWRPYNERCYFFSVDTKTWSDAQADCEGKGSNLMSILDIHERTWLRTQLGSNIYWIGLNDIVSEGVWEWSDGSVYYPYLSYWKSGQPDNWDDNEDCGQAQGESNGQWNDEPCNTRRRYICKRLNPNPPVVCDTANGWHQYTSSCYKLEADTRKSWVSARLDCLREGADLVSILSAEEEQYVISRLDSSQYDLWTGYSTLVMVLLRCSEHNPTKRFLKSWKKRTAIIVQLVMWPRYCGGYVLQNCTAISCAIQAGSETFHWSDASPSTSYLPWGENEPNLSDKQNGVCVATVKEPDQGSGKWRSHVCRYERPYMCKRGLNTICPAGWLSFSGNCYWVVSNYALLTTWHEAQSKCSSMGANLVTIQSEPEQFAINALLPDFHQIEVPDIWIGVSDKDQDGSFNWVDKTPIGYSNWKPGYPQDQTQLWDCGQIYTALPASARCPFQYSMDDCVQLYFFRISSIFFLLCNPGNYNGLWETTNCFKNLGYICKMTGGQNVKPTTAPDSHCDTGYLLFGDFCYHFESETVKNWEDAETYCGNQNGHLASIHSEEEISFLSDHRGSDSMTYFLKGIMFGLMGHQHNDEYSHCSDLLYSQGFLLWDNNQPDNWQGNEDCIQVRGVDHTNPGTLNDQFCTSTFPFICRKAKGQGPPLTPPTTGPGWNEKCGSWTPDPFNDYCYLFNYLSMRNWADARADCVNQGGNLLSITKPVEQAFIQTQIQTVPTGISMWMGGHDSITEGGWEWTDGSPFRYVHWADGNPDDYYGEDCLSILVNSGKWNDDNCDYERGYICKRREMRCPSTDWHEYGDFCYKPFTDLKTWHAARSECRKLEADLVSILSIAEQSWMDSYLYLATGDVWTGLNDLEFQGFFTWSDQHEVQFTYWAPGEPNNHDGFKEDCVEMLQQTGRWNDVPCTEINEYICKKPKDHYPVPSVRPTIYGCPEGWDVYSYSCYWMEEIPKTWFEAKAFCEEKDSKLLHIMDIYEQSYFTAKLAGYSSLWWIGLRGKGNIFGGVDYIWDNEAAVTFTHWDRDQPDTGEGTCVAMTSGPTGGFWDDKVCEESFPFVCEKARDGTSPPTPVPTVPPAQGCNAGWSSEPGFRYCYKFFMVDYSEKKNWYAAREDCLSRGSELVSVHSGVEENFLSTYSKGKTKWIGLQHNAIDGGYQWSDGTPVSYTNWGPGEPNNHLDQEDCVEMVSTTNGSSYWNDLNCGAVQDWICMITKGKNPSTPASPIPPVPAPECGTNPGWRKHEGVCYYYNDTDHVDFYTAMIRCWDEKAQLVSILSKEEQEYVSSMVGTGNMQEAWIGLRMFGITGGEYMWLDESPVLYVHWGPGEPNNANGEEQCVQISRYPGTWNDVNCGRDSAGYVCKKYPGNDHTRPPPTQPWTGNCPQGWMLFRNKCYMFKGNHLHEEEFKANWTFAQQWCRTQGGDLAVIDDQYENDFVASYLKDLVEPVWIGLSDTLYEDKFAWSDGSQVLYTNWAEKEPNNGEEGEHCASMTHNHLVTGRWNDEGCHRDRGWVCYMKKSSSNPEPPPTQNPCPSGYTSWYNNCYKLVEEHKTWEEAQLACEQEKGNLASIDYSYDQAFVAGAVLQGMSDAWIGLRRKEGSDSYSWSDGWPVFFTNWGPGEPTNEKGEGCVSMHSSPHLHGVWNDTLCNSAKAFLCKITSDKPPPTPAPGDGNCLPGWWPYGYHCYFVYNGKTGFSWPESRYYCQLANSELASLHSRAEVEFLRNINYTKSHNVWIGLTKNIYYGWSWTDQTSLGFLNWAPGEPNSAIHPGDTGGEDCVEMYPDGQWNDNNCVQKRGFACRGHQFYTTDENETRPTGASIPSGEVVGAVIGAVLFVGLICGLLYYVVHVRGVRLSDVKLSLPTKFSRNADVEKEEEVGWINKGSIRHLFLSVSKSFLSWLAVSDNPEV